ncbi:MAG TPA: TolC family protein [Campylobacteraceae bacterium]|nr:TolC family protein [Campylobacteraceae bacterium]
MKKVLILPLVVGALLLADSPLSPEKEKLFTLKRKQQAAETTKLKNSWISPLRLSASWQRNVNAGNFDGTTTGASVRLNQDIFRSGGIWYAVDYAKALGEAQALGIEIEEAGELQRLYTLKVQYERDTLTFEQAKLTLKNREIDADVVRERYKAGEADISELSRVMLQVDQAENQVITLENALASEKYELRKLYGHRALSALTLPRIPLVDKEDYLTKNLELQRYRRQIESDEAKYKTIRASYLPKVSLSGNYGYSKFRGDFQNYDGDEYGYGIQLSMPLDYNSKKDIESNKLAYMQSRIAREDRKKELESEYAKRLAAIHAGEKKIEVAKRMLQRYDELYRYTRAEFRAGTKTDYDVASLKNSLKIQRLEQKIQHYNILLEKLPLFFAMKR